MQHIMLKDEVLTDSGV